MNFCVWLPSLSTFSKVIQVILFSHIAFPYCLSPPVIPTAVHILPIRPLSLLPGTSLLEIYIPMVSRKGLCMTKGIGYLEEATATMSPV